MKILGLDFGNVISKEKPLSMSRDENFMDREYVEDALTTIQKITPWFEDVWIVSKCSEASEVLIPQWLKRQNFYEITGIKPQNIRFCRERADKAVICKELGIDCFIDDRMEVLSHMKNMDLKFALNPMDADRFPDKSVDIVKSWTEIDFTCLVLANMRAAKGFVPQTGMPL